MLRNLWAAVAAMIVLGSSPAWAQTTLHTGRPPNPGVIFHGQMFDVTATNEVTILGFAAQITPGPVRIWGRPGSHDGFMSNPGGWTLLGSGVVTVGGSIQPIPVVLNTTIPAGQTYAFYIDADQTIAYDDTPPGAFGDAIASDANVTIRSGTGIDVTFSPLTVRPRALAGSMTYNLGAPPPPVPTLTEWAMILFGVLLAGGAMLMIQRRRLNV